MTWKKLTNRQINDIVTTALGQNVDFKNPKVLGVPASYLDEQVFYSQAPFLKDAPFLRTLIQNPNHIGCHTIGQSEYFFHGTQAIEKEVIKILSEDLLHGAVDQFDGYIASGGTEANTQALWMYRNYFMHEHKASLSEIGILHSTDTHYSAVKAANLLQIKHFAVPVDSSTRKLSKSDLDHTILEAMQGGVRFFVVVANMMTTMFGSVDDIHLYTEALERNGCGYKLHVDAAYGGFIYPVANPKTDLDFSNPKISSITLDAHKMLQAPYGTGVFITRKGLIHHTHTAAASYVEGQDTTLIGSRSGANAVAVWMILQSYGPYGWYEKIQTLLQRTQWLSNQLKDLGIRHFREPQSNIVTILAEDLEPEIARDFGLVPDHHEAPMWHKVVVMDHVTIDVLVPFVETLKGSAVTLEA